MALTRRQMLLRSAGFAGSSLLMPPLASLAQTGAPAGAPDAYAKPKPDLQGPFQPRWESLRDHYTAPSWFRQAKFGIFIHWGLYSIPAHHSEWYSRYMYTTDAAWHTEHYGPPDKFGYKDFIPLFKPVNFHAEEWVSLFQRAGARYMCPVGEHHDGFAMWDSDLTPWCAGKMGPKRDLLGELAAAARKANMIWGTSTHRMEHHNFMYPAPGVPNDQFDPRYAGFYGPPMPGGNMNAPDASEAFQLDWLARIQELVDKYQPQILYMDNGVNPREYDPVKLRAAAYLYNRAREHGYETAMCTKQWAYLFANVQAFETAGGSPKWIYPGDWQCDTPIGNSWGYIKDLKVRSAYDLLLQMASIASVGGNYMLNVSPTGDGSIPADQQAALLTIGDWLRVNGEAIYGSSAWIRPGEGPTVPSAPPQDWRGWPTGMGLPNLKKTVPPEPSVADFRFTAKEGKLYAIGLKYPQGEAQIRSFNRAAARVERVTLLDGERRLDFHQTAEALVVKLPATESKLAGLPYVLRVEGSLQTFGVS